MNYRRLFIPNSFIFLTIVTSKRRPILINNIKLLRRALKKAVENYNCKIIAICVLPEHIHMIIKPYQINDYPYFVKQFKTYFSTNIDILTLENYELTNSNINKKERDVWQRRYFEHTIVSEDDLCRHFDYIHFNPVKHNLVTSVKNWEYSSFKNFVKNNYYDMDWCNFGDKNKIQELDYE